MKALRFLQPQKAKSRGNTIEVTLHGSCNCRRPVWSSYYDDNEDYTCDAETGEEGLSFDGVEEALIYMKDNLSNFCPRSSWISYITHYSQYGEWDFASTVEFIPFAKKSYVTNVIILGGLGIASTVE